MTTPMKSLIIENGRLKLANVVTLSRGLLIAPVLILLLLDHPRWALAVYLAACSTDLIDGWLARRSGQASPFGAQLDAGVDNIFSVAILTFLIVGVPGVSHDHLLALIVLFGGPLLYLPVSKLLAGRVMMFHFWSAKAGAFLLFILWPLVALTGWSWWITATATVVGLSRLEQIVFILRRGADLDAPHGFCPVSSKAKAAAQ
ncbi:CDP-alcohol phosphatidyltransferase family protein [Phenylobacterium sp.]|uniref:CDP-alcohol phosphatidyltransferase family protein n=1 Tax=Phenylobacterium sp. TaxID=1871053 RepID=UPI00272FC198|nr:CDP-alcohol phosphatidyltransferase family protein [Phenylobacterium sp.]MDP1600400.1 CDP-alcohol phosphatidyltransferase family protein [Phenylobacterium sp.]MDP3594795.1 CDP-alcohol phosphatidyltransferase family protein [Phenylobacterium sp.]